LDVNGTRLRVVVSCVARKRIPPTAQLQMRSVGWRGPISTARLWTNRLEQSDAPALPATDLYMGDHWKVATSLRQVALMVGIDLELWVVSAGYGLVRHFDPMKSYAATFAQGHLDSVAPNLQADERRKALREWWSELSNWRGVGSSPRSLEELALEDPQAPILAALSSKYLDAVTADLLKARSGFDDPDLLLVVSAGAKCVDQLSANIVPTSADLQHAVGGSLVSLNVRIARWIVSHYRSHRFERRQIVQGLHDLAPRTTGAKRNGLRLSDSAVKTFVRGRLRLNTRVSPHSLLRELRNKGQSCEAARFARLFDVVAGGS